MHGARRACLAAPILALFLTGCQSVGPFLSERNGHLYAEFPGQACPTMAEREGCYLPVRAIFYSDEQTRIHEIEHGEGMQHAAWHIVGREQCAEVTESGAAAWHRGDVIYWNGDRYHKP